MCRYGLGRLSEADRTCICADGGHRGWPWVGGCERGWGWGLDRLPEADRTCICT
jgi:hypothetical protein